MLRLIVPDTCALAASLYNELFAANADPLLNAIRLQDVDALAPSLGKAEFLNLSRKKLATPGISTADVEAVVSDFVALPILWVEIDSLTANAWRLHRDYGLETGDAFFLEVARQWQAEVWTTDEQFFNRAAVIHPYVFNLRVQAFS